MNLALNEKNAVTKNLRITLILLKKPKKAAAKYLKLGKSGGKKK